MVAEGRRLGDWGRVADYIPELAHVDPAQLGVAVCLPGGEVMGAGDWRVPFSIQSVSKVFTLALVLGRGGDDLWRRVGREPSGTAFDSIVLLERERGRPRNPFINAGALVVTDALLAGRAPAQALAELMGFVRAAAGAEDIPIDEAVARSEKATGHRNLALAHYLRSHGNLLEAPERVFGTYAHQCAIAMDCAQLARAGAVLARLDGAPALISAQRARRITALMATCGHYDGSGEFAFRVGLPGKSGVGGGILVVAPRRASIAVWSPGLDLYGNSKMGTWLAEQVARRAGWSAY
jgi:glutaminase